MAQFREVLVLAPGFKTLNLDLGLTIQGVPKKTHDSGFLAITLLWKGLGRKVGCVLKNSGNSLSDRHQNFSISPIKS